jgi:hypothetical protein
VALDLEQVAHELPILVVVFDDQNNFVSNNSPDNSPAKALSL